MNESKGMNDNEKRRKAAEAIKGMAGNSWPAPAELSAALGVGKSATPDDDAWRALAELVAPQLPDGVEWPKDADGEPIDPAADYEREGQAGRIRSLQFAFDEPTLKRVELQVGCRLLICRTDELHKHVPDSWERIEKDARKDMQEYWACGTAYCGECPSTIEGKPPYAHYRVDSCKCAKAINLVARCKALAERGER